MKYLIVIPDGAADVPLDELGGRTPLEAARTPHLDRLAMAGRVGTANTTPEGFGAGSDVCSMCLLGYDPAEYHTGRAPLEAAAMGLDPEPTDLVYRLNFVTVGVGGEDDGQMLDHSAGGLSSADGAALAEAVHEHWMRTAPELAAQVELHHSVDYRCILVHRGAAADGAAPTTPPHEIPGEPWHDYLPADHPSADALRRLMSLAGDVLAAHPINLARREANKRPANAAWIWGGGPATRLPSFASRFGLKGAMITAVDLLRGIGRLIGWDLLEVPGITGYHDTDYDAQGRATVEALETYDIVCTHIESPDEAAHQADAATKVAAIEAIDRAIIGPAMAALERRGDPEINPGAEGWRVLVMPDHYTLCTTRKHDATPPPLAVCGSWIRSVVSRRLIETDANESDLHIEHGHELMEYFLRSGLKGVSR